MVITLLLNVSDNREALDNFNGGQKAGQKNGGIF